MVSSRAGGDAELMADLLPFASFIVAILGSFGAAIVALVFLQKKGAEGQVSSWFCTPDNRAKREFENWALQYTCVWISVFAVVIIFKMYEWFDANAYMALCVSLALPYLLQPVVWPLEAEKALPLTMRYSFKANVWIAIFSFIGNYWYTHYFYSVLKAKYTFPSLRLNNVPICLFFATHFYFVTYHSLSNLMLRKIETTFAAGPYRSLLFWVTVVAFSYFTAFMETLTISSFEYYEFENRSDVYRYGSAFYGIYFLVSYPVFYRLDEKVSLKTGVLPHTMFQTVMEAMGTSMVVLLLLDFARIALKYRLDISGCASCNNEKGLDSCSECFF